MIYKTSSLEDIKKAHVNIDTWAKTDCKFELKKLSNSRTSQQNRALHLFCSFVSNELNELGLEFHHPSLITEGFTTRYTMDIVKNNVWRPIQIALFDKVSTKDLDTKQMNEIIDVITKFFGDRGVNIEFPSIDTLINK